MLEQSIVTYKQVICLFFFFLSLFLRCVCALFYLLSHLLTWMFLRAVAIFSFQLFFVCVFSFWVCLNSFLTEQFVCVCVCVCLEISCNLFVNILCCICASDRLRIHCIFIDKIKYYFFSQIHFFADCFSEIAMYYLL